MVHIERDEFSPKLEMLPHALSISLRSAVKRKNLSRSMRGLKALRMGEGYSFRPLQEGVDSFSQMGGGLGSFLKEQVLSNINHIGPNGLVEVSLHLDKMGVMDQRASLVKGENKRLCQYVRSYLEKRNQENLPFWKFLGASKRIKLKFFFVDGINSRELASVRGGKAYINGDELVVFVHKEITPYNYSNAINLMAL